MGEQQPGRDVRAEGRAQPRGDADGEDGVTAEGEEVVVGTDLVGVQDVRPGGGDEPLGRGPRRGPRAVGGEAVGARRGQGSPVELAVGGERQRGHRHVGGRHHVRGQQPFEVGAEFGGRRRCGTLPALCGAGAGSDDVGDKPPRPRGILVHTHDGRTDARVTVQGGLDLAGFDAVAADLDLLVGAAQVLQGAVGAPAGPVPGAVHAGARAPKGSARKRVAVSPGRFR